MSVAWIWEEDGRIMTGFLPEGKEPPNGAISANSLWEIAHKNYPQDLRAVRCLEEQIADLRESRERDNDLICGLREACASANNRIEAQKKELAEARKHIAALQGQLAALRSATADDAIAQEAETRG